MSTEKITITVDGKEITVPSGVTILQAAESAGITIPTICFHEQLTPPGLCRQCVVEVEGARRLQPSCISLVREGMVVKTDSEKVRRVRRTNLEMLSAVTDLSESPEIVRQMEQLDADEERFAAFPRGSLKDDNPFYVRDYTKCILCMRCVQVCSSDIQFSYALAAGGRGFDSRIATFYNKDLPDTTCVFCGNCIQVCPTGALKAKTESNSTEVQHDED